MRITTRFLLIFVVSSVIFMVGFFLVLNYTLIDKIKEIEVIEVINDGEVVNSVIEFIVENLRLHAIDFGGWDEMYENSQNPDPDFMFENIDDWVGKAFGVAKAQIIDADKKILHAFTEESHVGKVSDSDLYDFIFNLEIFEETMARSSVSGIAEIDGKAFYYATSIITTTEVEATDENYYVVEEDSLIGGMYFVMKFFDEQAEEQISEITGLPISFHVLEREAGKVVSHYSCPETPCGTIEELGDLIIFHQPIFDENGRVVAYSEFSKSREAFQFFIVYVRTLTLLVTGIVAAFLMFLMLVVWQMVTRPLKKLSDDISGIDIDNPRLLKQSKRPDEIGEVAKAFNRVLTTVKKYYQEVAAKTDALEKASSQTEERLGTINKMNKYMVGRELEMDRLKKQAIKYKSILKKNKIDDPFAR